MPAPLPHRAGNKIRGDCMAKEPRSQFDYEDSEAQYRRKADVKARRRRKRQIQRLLLLGAFVLAAVLLVVCIVMIFRSIFGDKTPSSSSSSSSSSSISSSFSFPTTGPGLSWRVAGDPDVWNLVLVNKNKPMADGFRPAEEVPVSDAGHLFDGRAAGALKEMIAECNAVPGNSLKIYSALRGSNKQQSEYERLYNLFVSQGKSATEAEYEARRIEPPYGQSDHQTGLGVAFVTSIVQAPSEDFAQTPEYDWLVNQGNAQRFGFVLRFPEGKEAITGIKYLPYHFRYVGVEDAQIMNEDGICLEEYLAATPPVTDGGDTTDTGGDEPGGSSASNAGGDGQIG